MHALTDPPHLLRLGENTVMLTLFGSNLKCPRGPVKSKPQALLRYRNSSGDSDHACKCKVFKNKKIIKQKHNTVEPFTFQPCHRKHKPKL